MAAELGTKRLFLVLLPPCFFPHSSSSARPQSRWHPPETGVL